MRLLTVKICRIKKVLTYHEALRLVRSIPRCNIALNLIVRGNGTFAKIIQSRVNILQEQSNNLCFFIKTNSNYKQNLKWFQYLIIANTKSMTVNLIDILFYILLIFWSMKCIRIPSYIHTCYKARIMPVYPSTNKNHR